MNVINVDKNFDNSISIVNPIKSKSHESFLTSTIFEISLSDSSSNITDTTQNTKSSKCESSFSNASTSNEVVVILNGQILQRPPLPFDDNVPIRGRSATPIRIAFDPIRSRLKLNSFFQRRVHSAPAHLRNNFFNQRSPTASFNELVSRRARLYISRRPLFDGDSSRNITNENNDVMAIGENNIGLHDLQGRLTRVRLWQVQQNRAMIRNAAVSVSTPQVSQANIPINEPQPPRSIMRQARSNSLYNLRRPSENFPIFRRRVSFIINNELSETQTYESETENITQIEAENNNNNQEVINTNNNNQNHWSLRCLIS